MVVVLPAPFGPRKPQTVCRGNAQIDRAQRDEARVALAEAVGLDGGDVRGHGSAGLRALARPPWPARPHTRSGTAHVLCDGPHATCDWRVRRVCYRRREARAEE